MSSRSTYDRLSIFLGIKDTSTLVDCIKRQTELFNIEFELDTPETRMVVTKKNSKSKSLRTKSPRKIPKLKISPLIPKSSISPKTVDSANENTENIESNSLLVNFFETKPKI